MTFDAIIVGGGIAGLTSAAFLSKAGRSVLLCEKEERPGGLVGSFPYKGFIFDAGIRAMENSGVLLPMLKALDIQVDFIKSPVSIGIGDQVVHLASRESMAAYQHMLTSLYPGEASAIASLMRVMEGIMDDMAVLYGIDNPLFMDLKNDREYLRGTLLPWMFKYMGSVGRIKRLNLPVEDYLGGLLKDRALRDIIAQHFFKRTPAFFALSYFSLYLDYRYPRGGTGALIDKLAAYIQDHGGTIRTGTRICSVDAKARTIEDSSGEVHTYRHLVWAADQKALYGAVTGLEKLPAAVGGAIRARRSFLEDKTGGDSVLTLYLTCKVDKDYFGAISSPHFFYTPDKRGLGALQGEDLPAPDGGYPLDQARLFAWTRKYLALTTYEISIPCLRDATLAPAGQTGLIISTLMDHALVSHISQQGWYEAFKALCRDTMTQVLQNSIYPRLAGQVTEGFVSTPLTLEKRTGNTGGAITGWAFSNKAMPAVSSMPRIASSVRTPIPHVSQAGQWTYSPSGLPISILTGKLASDRALKALKRQA
ncbi:MAG: phytoene desaturase family protein [Christensenellales bacterium]